jgi:ABC-2 type transport system ATP-binding protein
VNGPPVAGDPPAVAMRSLTKRFGDKTAVDRVDLDIARGSFFGLVGPNGAGKSTTMKMCTGLLRPDDGDVRLLGTSVWTDPVAAKARIGVLPEGTALFERLTGRELLTYNGLLRAMDPDVVDARTDELLDVLGLRDDAGTLVVDYSTGMRKKIALGAALLHAPPVLFLDEPFEAVDPVSARTIQSVLERFCDAGGTVIFSSHVMDVVQRLCDHVAIIAEGRVVVAGTIDDVRGGRSLEDVFVDAVGARPAADGGLVWLSDERDV